MLTSAFVSLRTSLLLVLFGKSQELQQLLTLKLKYVDGSRMEVSLG